VVARLGGDEFAVLLWNLSAAQAEAKARELEAVVAAAGLGAAPSRVCVGASAGSVPLRAELTPAQAIEAADTAMYARKRARRAG
jgi:diguanylate cyclase (GGDEF)-like protein